MQSVQISGARNAPSPEILRRARIEAAGVSPTLAVALADLVSPGTKRDDVAMLASLTASRVTAAAGWR